MQGDERHGLDININSIYLLRLQIIKRIINSRRSKINKGFKVTMSFQRIQVRFTCRVLESLRSFRVKQVSLLKTD
jgi:hypothetical protein